MGLEIFSITNGENWERLAKYFIVYIIMYLIFNWLINSVMDIRAYGETVATVIMALNLLIINMATLSLYEKWRGCKTH